MYTYAYTYIYMCLYIYIDNVYIYMQYYMRVNLSLGSWSLNNRSPRFGAYQASYINHMKFSGAPGKVPVAL